MLNDFIFRVRAMVRRKSVEAELDDELRFHFDQQVEKFVASGLSYAEALRRTRLQFGGLDQIKEECRDVRGLSPFETLAQDVRYGFRVLLRTPVVASIAVLSLALGIGANTAVFSLINTVMLRLLPVEKPEELVQIYLLRPKGDGEPEPTFTNPLWEQLRDRQDVFSGMFSWSTPEFDLAPGGEVHRINGLFVSGEYFSTLGVRPAAGRLLSSADDRRGCPALATLSYGFWQSYFGGSQNAIGATLSIDHQPFQIIGVSSSGFHGLDVGRKFDVAIPVCSAALFDGEISRLDRRSWWWLKTAGRVNPNTSPEQVKARLDALSPGVAAGALPQDWSAENQKDFLGTQLVAVPAASGTADFRRRFKEPLQILTAVVSLVLLIACANIASLMFARAAARNKEVAVRKALGASRSRLIRQLLTECILLSLTGALLGTVFARWGAGLLVRFLSTQNRSVFLDLSIDRRVLAFTAVITVFTAMLSGLLPALSATRVSVSSAIKGAQATESDDRRRFRLGKWIIAAQVAMSLVLLVGAGLFLRSLVKIVTLDIGFDRENVLIVNVNLKAAQFAPSRRPVIFDDIEKRLRALPGVTSASRSVLTPINNATWNNFIHVDSPNPPSGDLALVYFNFVSPSYFTTMRTPLLAGRDFNFQDTGTSTQVAIVNQTLAKRFFPGVNPIGKTFRIEDGPPQKVAEIVGIMKDAKYESLRERTLATAFFPITQIPEVVEDQDFELRTVVPPSGITSAAQAAIQGVSKAIPVEFRILSQQVGDSLVQERLLATLSSFFGALALLLAAIGLYGAFSYTVTQRSSEFGIRMALGAQRVSILTLVLRDVAAVLGVGIAAGLCISLVTVDLLHNMLFGLVPRDSLTFTVAALVLATVAFFAGYLPARRAMRSDPMTVLRYE